MKRVVRNRSGREIYSPKWQNSEANSSENEDDGEPLHSASVETNEIAQTTAAPLGVTETIGRTSEGQRIRLPNSHELMYRATLEGDCVAAEMLLTEFPNLASDEISEEGDRALHIAAALKHKEIVKVLVQQMSPTDLELLDGHGYTACCYAAISGEVDIADLLIRKNPTLATARDRENKTPLYKASFRGNATMVRYFLREIKVGDLPMEEWFDLLLVTVRREMYDVALEISGKNEGLATMKNDEGTTLHLLARQPCFLNRKQRNNGVMRQDMRLLAKKLWEGIQGLGQASALELMKNPPILNNAAEVGNVELITMLTQTYPHLIWHADSNGYTMFHIAVKHRHEVLFDLINEIGARKDSIATSQDENGNNILHLAAELRPRHRIPIIPIIHLKAERQWFLDVKAIVPPFCWEMRNKDGQTPSQLFKKEHKSMLEKNTTWMRNTADSCMLISTIIFSVVFASTFAPPGGYNQNTGIPLLLESNWFTCFIIFEAFAMFFSALSVLEFSGIMMASQDKYLGGLEHMLGNTFLLLSLSVFGAVSSFMSAYFLIYVNKRATLVKSIILYVYIVLVSLVFSSAFDFRFFWWRRLLPKRNRHSLFKRHADTVEKNKRRTCWIF